MHFSKNRPPAEETLFLSFHAGRRIDDGLGNNTKLEKQAMSEVEKERKTLLCVKF